MCDDTKVDGMSAIILSYQSKRFCLTVPNYSGPAKTELVESGWLASDLGYVTRSIKAALKFKKYADDKAKKVFDRVLVTYYLYPPKVPGAIEGYLDPHQLRGVQWILSRSRSYLAHAPGAGKTAQLITAACLVEGYPGQILFIVPPTLTINWQREIEKFHPKACQGRQPTVSIIGGINQSFINNWDAQYIIVPDSLITEDYILKQIVKMKWRFIGVDEASRFKEDSSQRSRALFGGKINDDLRSPGIIQLAPYAVLADGSPMLKRPMELWAPVFAMAPETIDFMDKEQFGFRYCGARPTDRGLWEFKGSANEDELKKKLQASFMHVVTEDELDHPERLRSMVFIKDVRHQGMKSWEQKHLKDIKFSDINENMSLGDLAKYRVLLGMKKVFPVTNYIIERLKTKGEKILVFAHHQVVVEDLVESLQVRGFKFEAVYGHTPKKLREEIFKKFQAGKLDGIVGNIQAMGRGHNLQRADRAIFAEYSWNDETNKQCEKRASRRGRSKDLPVRSDYLVVPDSLDELVLNSVFTAARRVKRIIG